MMMLFPLISLCQNNEAETIKLFYLGGQSNMDGFGTNSELPKSLHKEFKNVWIFHGNPVSDEKEKGGFGKWERLKPGHGRGFSSDGKSNTLANRFGVELSFAQRLQELYPKEKIALIKYSKGGSSIDSVAAGKSGSWEPDYHSLTGINQYDHFLTTVQNAFAVKDIDGDGVDDYLMPSGVIWMQGESDASHGEEIANRYYANLKRLMDLIRVAFRIDDLPVVIGKISDSWNDEDGKVWEYGELVQYAQEKYAKTDANAVIIRDTRYYKYSDRAHYDSGVILIWEKNLPMQSIS
jgi:hypothetical protein